MELMRKTFWISDFGFRISDFFRKLLGLDFRFWILDFGFFPASYQDRMLDFGFWILDLGFSSASYQDRILGFGFRISVR